MSINVDPSTWNLSTAGGLKYKLKEGYPTGTVGDGLEVQEVIIIQASDLEDFIAESFTAVELWPGGFYGITNGRSCPGFTGAMTKSIGFKPFEPGKPWSVTGDTSDTYAQFLELDIKYGATFEQADPSSLGDDLETYLEVSADMGVEFLQMKAAHGAKFVASVAHTKADGTTSVAVGEQEDPSEPNVPASKLQPHTEWTVRFPKFPWEALSYIMTNVRIGLGRVNSLAMPVFGGAVAETILFTGISIRAQLQFSETKWKRMAQVELKFSEKHIYENSVHKGHNHIYRPYPGTYDRLLINDESIYQEYNLNTMWS